jgi:hypothetical protein
MKLPACAALLALASVAAAQEARLEFEPRVGTTGTRVTVTTPLPKGSVVRFGGRVVPLLVEAGRPPSFLVPAGAESSFVEATEGGRVLARSTVPFVVAGASLVNTPRLVGLKEAIDVFGYSDAIPEGGGKPETAARGILSLGDSDVLTIGESAPPAPMTMAIGNDAASAATRGMGPAGFLFTARPPTRRTIVVPAPPPVPTPVPSPGPPGS